jgi:enoyl-CoA hydratase/carnithine racemase/methionyl-tRNA formyltransferase
MKILFLCTAHNSLSQRLYLALSRSHQVTIEYALTDSVMLEAVALSKPDLVICPFLTTFVPKQIYENVMTLIIHPGPPGDAGPSSIDWLLLGDDGTVDDPVELLERMDSGVRYEGRSHWGVTVLQADEEFDGGPVWAFQQFPIEDIDDPSLTKSSLYRGNITRAAIMAAQAAVQRVELASAARPHKQGPCSAKLRANPEFARLSVSDNQPFQGGITHSRPLLKASLAGFDISVHSAEYISRRIRAADSQPGAMSKIFGPSLYLYGGIVDDTVAKLPKTALNDSSVKVLATRDGAVCIPAADGNGVWITHVRRPKMKTDKALWPKVPAVMGLVQLGVMDADTARKIELPCPKDFSLLPGETLQEVWIDFEVDEKNGNTAAYLYFEHYNGAMSTAQCSRLIEAMDHILAKAATDKTIRAIVLMGGSYFSNGIALNVIEASSDPAHESWLNINRIDDVVQHLLHEFPSRNITTIAAIRGNAAAGGVALATACDFVIAGSDVVLNPAYRGIGLHGSEFHSLTYTARCGAQQAQKLLRAMLPLSPLQARQIGLVDFVFPGSGEVLDDHIQTHVALMLRDGIARKGPWKRKLDLSLSGLALARADELAEMAKDFWSPRSARYHARRAAFVRKARPVRTPLRFALHRRVQAKLQPDEEETAEFDDIAAYERRAESEMASRLRAVILSEMGSAPANGNVNGNTNINGNSTANGTATKHKPSLQPLLPPRDLLTPPAIDSKTLFSCHYQDFAGQDYSHQDQPMLTPPESPMPLYLPKMDSSAKFNNGGKKVGGAGVGGGRRTSTNGH